MRSMKQRIVKLERLMEHSADLRIKGLMGMSQERIESTLRKLTDEELDAICQRLHIPCDLLGV